MGGRGRLALIGLLLALALAACGQSAAGGGGTVAERALVEPTPTATATPPPTPTPTVTPTATPRPIPPTATPATGGRLPEGWRIYVGSSLPISLAHHGDWTVRREPFGDDYLVSFTAPGGGTFLGIGRQDELAEWLPTLQRRSNAEIAELLEGTGLLDKDGPFASMCDGRIAFDGVTRTPIAQSLFITLSYHCRYNGVPAQLQVSLGSVRDRGWVVFTFAPEAEYAATEARYFKPMLASLKID